jgi:ArsR family transcriptional regulator
LIEKTDTGTTVTSARKEGSQMLPGRDRDERAIGSLADDEEKADRVAEMLKALAHPLRLRILAILNEGDRNVNSLAERLGVSQSSVSQHLRTLRMQGLLVGSREGSNVRYALARPRLKELVKYLEGCPD